MKINWKEKLTSRKFWAAVVSFVAALLAAFCVDEMTIGNVVSIVSALVVVAVYIFTEGKIDAARLTSGITDAVPIADGIDLNFESWPLDRLKEFCVHNDIYCDDCETREEYIDAIVSVLEEERQKKTE